MHKGSGYGRARVGARGRGGMSRVAETPPHHWYPVEEFPRRPLRTAYVQVARLPVADQYDRSTVAISNVTSHKKENMRGCAHPRCPPASVSAGLAWRGRSGARAPCELLLDTAQRTVAQLRMPRLAVDCRPNWAVWESASHERTRRLQRSHQFFPTHDAQPPSCGEGNRRAQHEQEHRSCRQLTARATPGCR